MSDTDSTADFNQQIIDEFRANEGVVGGPFAGAPLLLLHTTGARSGQPRLAPLVYQREGDRIFIFGSKGGAPTHPDWYHNVRADPTVTVELGAETYAARAEDVTGAERDRIYAEQARRMEAFAEYAVNAGDRVIPVVELVRTSD